MATMYNCRPSELINLNDDYASWCLDEAIGNLILGLRNGRKLKPAKTDDNTNLIYALTGGGDAHGD